MVSEQPCPKRHIFPLIFNNSYLNQFSSILHRSARCMIPVVPRTWRFCGAKNDTNSQWILTILCFIAMSLSKFLLSPMVLDTFPCCQYFCLIATACCLHSIISLFNLNTFFQCFSNVFMLRLVGVYSGHLSNPQSAIDDMMRSKVLMFEKCRPA